MRRIVRELEGHALPDPHERNLSPRERERRLRQRRQWMRDAICRFLSDLITADIVGREVALTTRNGFGLRRGSLREHVQTILREELDAAAGKWRTSSRR